MNEPIIIRNPPKMHVPFENYSELSQDVLVRMLESADQENGRLRQIEATLSGKIIASCATIERLRGVYEKYKHLDSTITDPAWRSTAPTDDYSFRMVVLNDVWVVMCDAIRAELCGGPR